MGMFNVENPWADGGRAARVAEINSAREASTITENEYALLMREERLTSDAILRKRGALAVLLAVVGSLLILSSI